MKLIVLTAAASMLATAAFAQSTTVTRTEGPAGERTTVTRENDDGSVTKRTTETTGTLGCETKSVTRTDDLGDKETKTRTTC